MLFEQKSRRKLFVEIGLLSLQNLDQLKFPPKISTKISCDSNNNE